MLPNTNELRIYFYYFINILVADMSFLISDVKTNTRRGSTFEKTDRNPAKQEVKSLCYFLGFF